MSYACKKSVEIVIRSNVSMHGEVIKMKTYTYVGTNIAVKAKKIAKNDWNAKEFKIKKFSWLLEVVSL